MPLWGKTDTANDAPIYAPAQIKQEPTATNANAMYGNTTGVGLIAVDASEIAQDGGNIAHTGWVLRTVGTGRRSSRVQTEVLVAGGISGDNPDDGFAQGVISFSTNLSNKSVANATANSLLVVVSTTPVASPSPTFAYRWQANTGSGFANLSNAGVYGGTSTATLTISNTAGLNGVQYRVFVTANGYSQAQSAVATLTVS